MTIILRLTAKRGDDSGAIGQSILVVGGRWKQALKQSD